ncbi:MAG: Bax inhibitor-1/YccA family protein [Micropruina sp.]|uniref:Bax inhibitor-1/YccA family protein n=1 Tax=Micropruina sp. TaxID=2737536 RepID=UPI0039E3A1F8
MRSSNPVLSRPDAFTPQQQQNPYGYQQYGQPQGQFGYQQPGQPFPGQQYPQDPVQATRGVMTIDDVITKSAITMGTVIASAALTFMFLPRTLLLPAMIVSALVGFVTVLLVSARRVINPGMVLAYAAIEGVFIGAVSKVYESAWGGIVPTAVMATLITAAATLGAYKFFRIKVNNKFRKMVMIGTMAYAAVLLVNFVLSLFGMGFLFSGGNLAFLLLISAIGVGLAVFNLILDFDYIEQGIAMRAPESESWRGAFGLTVTMVWLYIEMLRLLSYFRSN